MNRLRRVVHRIPVQWRVLLVLPLFLAALLAFLVFQNWPTLTPEATLRRMERSALQPPGEIVAQGGFTYEHLEQAQRSATANYYVVTRTEDRFAVAALERFWGIFYRPAQDIDYFVSGWRYWTGQLERFDLGSVHFFQRDGRSERSNSFFENVFIITSQDPAVVRVEVTAGYLPSEARSDPAAYLEESEDHAHTVTCTEVAPGVFFGQHAIPLTMGDSGGASGPVSILRGYDAAGNLIQERLPPIQ